MFYSCSGGSTKMWFANAWSAIRGKDGRRLQKVNRNTGRITLKFLFGPDVRKCLCIEIKAVKNHIQTPFLCAEGCLLTFAAHEKEFVVSVHNDCRTHIAQSPTNPARPGNGNCNLTACVHIKNRSQHCCSKRRRAP